MDQLTIAAINFQQSAMMSKVDYAVAGKMLQSQNQRGAAEVELVEAASRGMDRAGDALVAAATGMGGKLDTYA